MSPIFSAKPLTIGKLLSDPYIFRVPSFQRPFSWTIKEAGQLLDDLLEAMRKTEGARVQDNDCFLGTILVIEPKSWLTEAGDAPRWRVCDIVDGQQRLVTLTILSAVLRDLAAAEGTECPACLQPILASRPNGSGERRFRVELRGRDRDFFQAMVQEPGASEEMPDADGLNDAERRIIAVREHFLTELSQRTGDELAQLATFVADHCHIALISADTIDRAHGIFTVLNCRGRPLERNDILKAQILGRIDVSARSSALAIWDRIAELVGDDFEALFSHIRTIEGQPKSQIISEVVGLVGRVGGPLAFVETVLEPYGMAFYAITRAQHVGSPRHSADIRRWLAYLGWLGSSDWIPPAMLWWRLHSNDADKLAVFIRRLERLAYSMRLLGIGADKRQIRFQAVTDAIRNGTIFDERRSPLELNREEQRNILYNLRSLHTRSPLTCKLVLLRLNDELAGSAQNLLPSDYTVEHVLPQKPARNSVWRAWFPLADERETCTNSLGNLVLVTRQQNDRARNMELARKLDVYFGSASAGVPCLTAELKGISQWRAPQILAREERLISLTKQIWSLDWPRAGAEAAPPEAPPTRQRARRRTAPASVG